MESKSLNFFQIEEIEISFGRCILTPKTPTWLHLFKLVFYPSSVTQLYFPHHTCDVQVNDHQDNNSNHQIWIKVAKNHKYLLNLLKIFFSINIHSLLPVKQNNTGKIQSITQFNHQHAKFVTNQLNNATKMNGKQVVLSWSSNNEKPVLIIQYQLSHYHERISRKSKIQLNVG